jgi:hypothetical protein
VKRFNTLGELNPPAAIYNIYSTAVSGLPLTLTLPNAGSYGASIIQAQIQSAFGKAGRELSRYARFPALWDGYSAGPFSKLVLVTAAKVLGYSELLFLDAGVIPELVTTGPASDGSIDVEIRVADQHLFVTLYEENEGIRLTIDREEGITDDQPVGDDAVERWISWLHRATVPQVAMAADSVHPEQ